MTEEEARAWLDAQFDVSRETWAGLERYVALLLDEMERQNLIAASTRDHVWARHIVDSAQLLLPAKEAGQGVWLDLGAGAGLPGIVVALLRDAPVVLIEERRKRVEFLRHVIAQCGLGQAQVFGGKVERYAPDGSAEAAVISARAYAPLPRLLESAAYLAGAQTLWVLPKGRNWQNEVETAQALWHFVCHVERSVTDGEGAVLVLRSVRAKTGRQGRQAV